MIWPWDLHPTLLDDMVVFGIYLSIVLRQWRKILNARHTTEQGGSRRQERADFPGEGDLKKSLTLQGAYKLLRVAPSASRDELRRAYHGRVASNHPDKVSHLSEELQQRAQELTQRLNRAYDMIQRHKRYK